MRKVRERRREGVLVAEGVREVERALQAGLAVRALYVAPALLPEWAHGGEEVSDRVLAKMAYRAEPEGVVAIFETPRRTLPDDATLLLVAVGIEKPGNLGAMARTAEAAGADALIVAEAEADPWNPNAIRASTGAVFTLPIVEATIDEVRELGTRLVAATPTAPTAYTELDLIARTTVAIGAEDEGLSEVWLDAADDRASIPLASPATADSLNAATAAAVILFEARRQRAHA